MKVKAFFLLFDVSASSGGCRSSNLPGAAVVPRSLSKASSLPRASLTAQSWAKVRREPGHENHRRGAEASEGMKPPSGFLEENTNRSNALFKVTGEQNQDLNLGLLCPFFSAHRWLVW